MNVVAKIYTFIVTLLLCGNAIAIDLAPSARTTRDTQLTVDPVISDRTTTTRSTESTTTGSSTSTSNSQTDDPNLGTAIQTVRLNVPVSVSNLQSEVTQLKVRCAYLWQSESGAPLEVTRGTSTVDVQNASYTGNVAVEIELPPATYLRRNCGLSFICPSVGNDSPRCGIDESTPNTLSWEEDLR